MKVHYEPIHVLGYGDAHARNLTAASLSGGVTTGQSICNRSKKSPTSIQSNTGLKISMQKIYKNGCFAFGAFFSPKRTF